MVKTEKGYYHVYHCISKEDIMEDEKFKDWIDDAPKNTVRQYLSHMLRYIDFRFKDEADRNLKNKVYVEVPVMTPTMLYEEAEEDRLSGVNPSDYIFTRRLKDFRAYLISSDGRRTGLPLSQNTIKAAYEGICAFYSHHNFMVDKKTRQIKSEDFKDRETQIQTNADYKITPDDMTQVLDNTELRDKAIVLVQASSGLSNSDVIQLTVRDFINGKHESGVTVFQLTRKKTGVLIITLITPEATKAVEEYLEYRNRDPHSKNPHVQAGYLKRKVNSDSDYLFCKKQISDEYLTTKNKGKDKEKIRQVSAQNIVRMYEELSPEGSVDKYDWRAIRGHVLRKNFNNIVLKKGKVHPDTAECFMGHKLSGVRDHYDLSDKFIEDLIREYLECVPHLEFKSTTVLERERVENDERVKKVVSDFEAKRQEDMRLMEEERNKMNAKIAELENKLDLSNSLFVRGNDGKYQIVKREIDYDARAQKKMKVSLNS